MKSFYSMFKRNWLAKSQNREKMRYTAVADSDVGISKSVNQDCVLIKQVSTSIGDVLMAIVCDGMGGLEKGELASATVIQEFARWFDEDLPFELKNLDMSVIIEKWSLMLKELNVKLLEYGVAHNISLGTTFSGILFAGDQYVIAHVGDTRVYQIDASLKLLTTDHSFVAREIDRGTMTPEQAQRDKRRNLLLQCVGASKAIAPQLIRGTVERGAYMLCSDGFWHEITEKEMHEVLNPNNLMNKRAMYHRVKYLIEQVKARKERDNISVILIKAE